MKASLILMALGVLLCIACILQLIHIQERPFQLTSHAVVQDPVTTTARESITFILGEDKDEKNPYYREAASYYSRHPEAITDVVVHSCRSLLEVRNYLEQYSPCNGKPWGLINLVTHGNQWVGMSVKVTPDSRRSTPDAIYAHVSNGSFPALTNRVLDTESVIFIHGCGIGNNHALLDAVALAFGGPDNKPVVRASRLFEYYSSVYLNQQRYTQRYMARAWFVCYPMGDRPSLGELTQQFHDKYPRAGADWSIALTQTQPRWTGDQYHYTFEIPLRIVLPINHNEVSLRSRADHLTFVQSREEVMERLSEMELTPEVFRWQVVPVYTDNQDGTRDQALLVRGHATMLTVLQPITREGEHGVLPFKPDVDDVEYYHTTRI